MMKIEILPKEKVMGELDLDIFESILKKTKLDLRNAVLSSLTITKNEVGWSKDHIADILFSEIDWTAVFMNFRFKTTSKMQFKICVVKYSDMIEYEKYAKDINYTKIMLNEKKISGAKYIVINSSIPNPEHTIDVWLSKSIFPYPESKWKKNIEEVI